MRGFYSLIVVAFLGYQALAQSAAPIPNGVPPLKTDAAADPVQAETMPNVYGTGLIYGRPTRGKRDTGMIYKSDESHLIVGNFQDDNKYAGNTWEVSTKSRAVFNKVDSLDQEKHYVFSYWFAYPMHWQMTDSSIELSGVTDSKESTSFPSAGLPYEMSVANGKDGNYTKAAVTNGRMVEVFRWNTYFLGRPICSFVLDQGGSLRGDHGPVANEVTFNVYSETGCKYVESILPYGLELKVEYDVAYLTLDHYDNFAHKIIVDKVPGLANSERLVSEGVSAQERAILTDPNFQKDLEELVTKYWEKTYGKPQVAPK